MPLGRAFPISAILAIGLAAVGAIPTYAQAALLMEEPYGLYGEINPTGHNAIYFQNICAETPLKLRRCRPGELGAVISRYEGVDKRDWVAIPLIPYLYSVENISEVPARVDHDSVTEMRIRYREAHFDPLGLQNSSGGLPPAGWPQLIGAAYERRIYAFRFETTREQDDALIARLNAGPNRSHFHMLTRNCADFSRDLLNHYFPGVFRRSFFPDAGITTPKLIASKLVHYARKHPEIQLTVVEIPQIPGYRRLSHSNKDVAESFSTTLYMVPVVLINPYLFGGIFVDYIMRGRYSLMPKNPAVAGPENLQALTEQPAPMENAGGDGAQVPGAASGSSASMQTYVGAESGLKGSQAAQ